jgi:electron-transferring-flavoprotein dehydrogenase
MSETREALPFDILFVGGGPANLAGAIHLMNMANEKGVEIEVGLIEKGDIIGSHSLSGAILDPKALKELLPDYLEKGFPVEESECHDEFYYLTPTGKFSVPYTPPYMHNDGCLIVSLSKLTSWLGDIAEGLGVNIFPGFAGTEVLYDEDGKTIIGVRTGDKGIDKEGNKKNNFEPGVDLLAKVTVFGEGPKGSLVREIAKKLDIFTGKMPQAFETAVKEVIELPETSHFLSSKTTVIHTFGYPLGMDTKGGGFLYKMKDRRISVGLVVGLDYSDPMLEPYDTFVRFKRHPLISEIIKGGKVLQQGAKTLSAGGFYTMPQLAVDGGIFVGDSASMLNIQRLKGIHTAMKSGMLAAETILTAIEKEDFSQQCLLDYASKVEQSWIKRELFQARNFDQALSKKGLTKFMHIGAQHITGGRGFVDPMPIEPDCDTLQKVSAKGNIGVEAGASQEFDGTLYVDKLTGVYLSGTKHEEDQPCHLIIGDTNICVIDCFEAYRNPCTRFCPGQVYEIVEEGDERRLLLNPSNCLHCKTCEIKDPYRNITWTCPEGGGGPSYSIT